MDWLNFVVILVSGVVGGNIAGAGLAEKSLGAVGNTIAGAVGGVLGGWILQAVGILHNLGMADVTFGSILGSVGASGVSGGVLAGIISMIKHKSSEK
jgi:uncharacterized membrane protein YeaQ/YmgE (transglycosylase-associated protein family)